jgi:hypothetical protein
VVEPVDAMAKCEGTGLGQGIAFGWFDAKRRPTVAAVALS